MIDVITHMMQFRYDIPVELVISVLSRVDSSAKAILVQFDYKLFSLFAFQNIILHLLFCLDACLFTARDNFPSVKFKSSYAALSRPEKQPHVFFKKRRIFFSLIFHSKSTYFWFFQTYGTDENLVK